MSTQIPTTQRFEDRLLADLLEHHPSTSAPGTVSVTVAEARTRHIDRKGAVAVFVGVASVAASAAVIAALMAAATGTPSPPPRRAGPTMHLTHAKLVDLVTAAITDVSGDVFHVQSTWSDGGHLDNWISADGNTFRLVTNSTGGAPTFDETYVTNGATQTSTEVNYATHTWATDTYATPSVPANCNLPTCLDQANGGMPPGLLIGKDTPESPAGVQWLLTKGQFTQVPGTQTIDGVTAFEITGSWPVGAVDTMWIDQDTDLPVRVTLGDGSQTVVTSDVTWLPPTAANLAQLHTVVPPGFTQNAGDYSR
ncbi:MAG TPA: hypothetical protein VGL48_17850 [Acidimicrobiales bacterium]|jgi:hypothetical protein